MAQEKNTIVIGGKALIVFAVSILVIGLIFFGIARISGANARGGQKSGNQVIHVSRTGYQYIFNPSTIKPGVVTFVADDSLVGCMSTITIPRLGVRETLGEGRNSFDVTITETGTYDVRCPMNMARGKFDVA